MGIFDKVRQAFGAGHATPEPPSPRDLFAAAVEQAVRQVPSVTSVSRSPEGFGLLVERVGKKQSLFLDNVFAETRDMSPEQRRERIVRFVRSMDTPDATAMSWEEVRPKLAPLLRTPALFGGLAEVVGDKLPIHRPFAPFLIECVGVDSENGISYAAPHMIARWGVPPSDVFAAAREMGRAYFTDDVGPYDPEAPYPLWHVARDDSYESSRLLVPGWLASFAGKVNGRPVAIAPHRSLLVVGGDGDERCLRRLIDSAAAEFRASPRGISPALYTVDDDGTVVPLVLPTGHALAGDVAVGHVMLAMSEYEAQKAQLDRRLGEDVFVASFQGLKSPEGKVISYTTWLKNVASLLPRTDQVFLGLGAGGNGKEVLRVPWPALMDVAADCLSQEPGLDPPRWRTKGWPTEEAIAELRAVAIT
jgi:hypothetical protein